MNLSLLIMTSGITFASIGLPLVPIFQENRRRGRCKYSWMKGMRLCLLNQ